MKKILAVAVLMLVCASAAFAAEAAKSPLSYWVGVSFNKASNDAFDALPGGAPKGGPGGMVGVNYAVTPDIAVGVMAGYLMLGKSDTSATIAGTTYTETNKLSAIPIIVHAAYMIPMQGGFKPYVGAGAGMYMLHSSTDVSPDPGSLSGSDNSSKFGFNGGAGFVYDTGGSMGYGIDARYHIISTDGTSTKLLTVAATLHFK